MRQVVLNKRNGRRAAIYVLTLALAGCSTIPAFGPGAETINRSASDEATVASDALPFEIVDVNATTMPSIPASIETFPISFQNQTFRGSDEIVEVGDQLEIRIWEVSEDGLFATAGSGVSIINVGVSNSGNISVPYANTIAAQGLTTAELRTLLLERYKGQAVEPEITVKITATESRAVTVLGDVRTPGRAIILSRGIKLLDLIAQAGGAPGEPWEVKIAVQRGPVSASLTLADVLNNATNNIVILPGDTVNLATEPRRFAVYGGVSRPTNIEIPIENAHLAYLLAEVGGLNDRVAQTRSVFVFRPTTARDASGKATAYRFDFSRADALLLASAFRLKPTDITYVASAGAADFQKFMAIVLSPLLGAASTGGNLGN